MKKGTKLFLILIISLITMTTFSSCTIDVNIETNDIVIVYTTDVHCGINDNIGYSALSAYIKKTRELNENVALVDAGDAIQGALIGSISKGKYIIDIMNELNYDCYTLGNHDFDYGLDELKNRIDEFDGDMISCNVSYNGQGENKLKDVKPYSIIDYGFAKVGFVGVTTPSVPTTSNPDNFYENGEMVFSFSYDNLFDVVQSNIDECHSLGCDYVILVTHLGYTDDYSPNSSPELIANTSGAVAVIDGHSHQTVPCNYYKNKDNEFIPLCTAGYKMNVFGRITITGMGDVHLGIITSYPDKDPIMEQKLHEIEQEIEVEASKVICTNNLALSIYDESGIRMARNREIGLGDLISDAFRDALNTDIGIINGGGIRDDLKKGDLTFGEIKKVLPFDNEICAVNATGQQILDYLEFASRKTQLSYTNGTTAIGENGGFSQVSGIKFTIDTSIESNVAVDSSGAFVSVDGERRVKDVYVYQNGEFVSIDKDKEYTVASIGFILLNGGDGANMFKNCEVVAENIMLDSDALTRYIVDVLQGNLKDVYENIGDRITIV